MDLKLILANLLQSWAETPKDWKFVCALISILVTCPTYYYYYKAVKYAPVAPTMSNWISWLLMDGAILAGMLGANVVYPQMVVYVLGTACVVWACIKRGATVGWKRLDTGCVVTVLVSIMFWWYTGDPLIAIVVSSVACLIGAIPLLINVYYDPTREPIKPWVCVVVGSLFALAALRAWDLSSAFTPVFFLGIQLIALGLTARRYRLKAA